MLPYIVRFGILAGLIVSVPMAWIMITLPAEAASPPGVLWTYVLMAIGLTMVLVGVRQYRDKVLGGAIDFAPALGLGLAISGVAGICYAIAWEISQLFMAFDFADFYANRMVENVRASGGNAEAVAAATRRAEDFLALHRNPLFRVPMSFLEIFPVGVLWSLISAGLLRDPRFLRA